MSNVSKSGVYVDTKTGKVVESQPEEGVQLVPPGIEITPDMEAAVDAAKQAASGSSEPKTVTTRAAKRGD